MELCQTVEWKKNKPVYIGSYPPFPISHSLVPQFKIAQSDDRERRVQVGTL